LDLTWASVRECSQAGSVASRKHQDEEEIQGQAWYELLGHPKPPRTRQKEVGMPKVVITHAVVDIERWLEGKSERAAAIASGSGTNVTDYVAHDGSNNIAITADVQDVDALQAMLASPSPEVAARMEEHGVVPPISAYVAAD
jgi:hypothetical protein